MTNNRPPLTVQEAPRALAVSDTAVRRMLQEGGLREHSRDVAGCSIIDPPNVDAASVGLGRTEPASGEARRDLVPTMTGLTQIAQTLADMIERQASRIGELSLELGSTQTEARRLPAWAAAPEQRAAPREQTLAQAREENIRLRDELARAQAQHASGTQHGAVGSARQIRRGLWARVLHRA